MRALPLVLAFFPSFVLADDIMLSSKVSDVTLYPQGAKIVRMVPFQAPAGSHVLQLIDLPEGTPMETVRVKVTGAAMGAVKLRDDYIPPADNRETEAQKAARRKWEDMFAALRAKEDEAQAIRAGREAADTRIAFLRQLGEGKALSGASADDLRDVARMIGEETLIARQAAIKAEADARATDREIKDMREELEKAWAAWQSLVPEEGMRNLVSVAVNGEAAMKGMLEITYYDHRAGWSPVYDAYLDRKDETLTLKRGALVRQNTGENWTGVALTMSTNAPQGAVEPGQLWPERKRIIDKVPMPKARLGALEGDAVAGAVMAPMPEPVIVQEAAANFDGLSVMYTYPSTLDLTSSADTVRVALGELSFDAKITAVAVPKRDESAFLMAEFTNNSGELILPSVSTQLFRDGAFIGTRASDAVIPAGAEARLPFGAIEGLRLTRITDRQEGDYGVLSRSNQIKEKVIIGVENLTGESWPLRVLDQVPYSEQEDLVITWNAKPRPSDTNVDDLKGVMAWESVLEAGKSTKITLEFSIEWPDGKHLR